MFFTGDHAITLANNEYLDSSYGSAPFDSIPAWENASIAGFAELVEPVGKTLVPVPYNYPAFTAPQCANKTCYFIAEQKPPGGWPNS